MKHTPGPWKVDGAGYGAGNVRPVKETGRNICTFSRCFTDDYEESKANARLIAAAPELLAALKNAMPWLVKAIGAGLCDNVDVPSDNLLNAFQQAWDAIKKAEGKDKP